MTGIGDNSVAGDRVLSFVQRIERLEEEIGGLNADKRDVYAEAKGTGLDVATIKRVVRARKMDPADRDEQDVLFDLYMRAIETASSRVRVHEDDPAVIDAARRRSLRYQALGVDLASAPDKTAYINIETGEVIETNSERPPQTDGEGAEPTGGPLPAADQNAPRPSTSDEPSPAAGPQAEAAHVGTGAGTPAGHEGRHEGGGHADEAAAGHLDGQPAPVNFEPAEADGPLPPRDPSAVEGAGDQWNGPPAPGNPDDFDLVGDLPKFLRRST